MQKALKINFLKKLAMSSNPGPPASTSMALQEFQLNIANEQAIELNKNGEQNEKLLQNDDQWNIANVI